MIPRCSGCEEGQKGTNKRGPYIESRIAGKGEITALICCTRVPFDQPHITAFATGKRPIRSASPSFLQVCRLELALR